MAACNTCVSTNFALEAVLPLKKNIWNAAAHCTPSPASKDAQRTILFIYILIDLLILFMDLQI